MAKCPEGYSWSVTLNKCVKITPDKGFITKPSSKNIDPGFTPKTPSNSLKKTAVKRDTISGGIQYKKGGSTPAWQRKEGKSPSGGLNAKGRASLKAAGHDIKAPQPGGGPRKKSFCARMTGMKKKLTSAKTANDPNSRINKSLRKWKC